MCNNSDESGQGKRSGPDWEGFFSNKELQTACKNYAKPVEELAFNPFVLMSDTYHRENFHSDILKAILSPNDTHGEGSRFLNLFYDLLIEAARWKKEHDKTVTVSGKEITFESNVISEIQAIKACGNVSVTRETGRTDIAICGSLLTETLPTNWVIIIENKINYASDQPRQLPKYVDFWTQDESGNEVRTLVAIVYIVPSDENAKPAKIKWDDEQKHDSQRVFSRLLTIPAYSENVSFSLFNFLHRCELEAKKFSSVALFRQYAALMKEQIGGNMDEKKETIDKVISVAVTNNFPLTALRDMLVDVSKSRADCLTNCLTNSLGKKWTGPKITKEYAVYVDSPKFNMDGAEYTLAIDVPFHDLDALGVVTFFVRDTKDAPVKDAIENLPMSVKNILKDHGLSSSSNGWAGMRYDDKWKWREGKTNKFYPCEKDLKEIANRILELIRALNACDDFKKLIKREMTLEVPVVNDSPQA